MTPLSYVILLFSALSFVLGFYFVLKARYKPNLWLGLLLFTFSYQIFYCVLYWTKFNLYLDVQLRFSHLLPTCVYGPLYYLYLRDLIKPKSRLKFLDLFHLIPMVLFFISYFNYYIAPYDDKVILTIQEIYISKLIHIPYFDRVLCLVMLVYLIVSYINFRKLISDKDYDLILWLRLNILLFGIFLLAYFAYYILFYMSIITPSIDYMVSAIMSLIVGLALYFAYQYPKIFNGESLNKIIPFVKYKKTGLSKELSTDYKNKLLKLMDEEKVFLDSTLRLNDLADKIGVSRNHMSQIINEHFDMNFFEYINNYRVSESIEILKTSSSSTKIIDVIYESGFNNRVSFYKSFKKVTGVTPKEYIKEHLIAS